jgi:aminoglycoside/choline kinase family phosphotransferase
MPTRGHTADRMEAARAWVERTLGMGVLALEPLAGGAGARRYWRVHTRGRAGGGAPASAILMHAAPEDRTIVPPALRGPSDEIPFVTVTRLLARHDLPVPEIYGVDTETRWVLEEDLGDRRLLDLPPAEQTDRRREVIDLLARAHAIPCSELPFERVFDREWIAFELALYREHGVSARHRERIEPALDALARAVAGLPRVFALRDVQSQNLMVDARGRLRMLDYQDALLAPAELDLAAFLWDSYVEIEPAERARLLERYAALRGVALARDALPLLVIQRKCKDYGLFRRLAREKRDLRYRAPERSARAAILEALPQLPDALAAVRAAIADAMAEAEA